MTELRFTQSHEWISADSGIATIGITQFAAQQLGDVVYVELPEPGKKLAGGAEAAVVESVKAASEIYAPVAGEVTEANRALADDPAMVNADPEGEAWFFRMKLVDDGPLAKLMTKDQYTDFVKGL
jgi:glycine cleavage system H protein